MRKGFLIAIFIVILLLQFTSCAFLDKKADINEEDPIADSQIYDTLKDKLKDTISSSKDEDDKDEDEDSDKKKGKNPKDIFADIDPKEKDPKEDSKDLKKNDSPILPNLILQHELEADLDGDGIIDIVRLYTYDDGGEYDDHYEAVLQVNDIYDDIYGAIFEVHFNIVDIDEGDRYLEIAVSEYGFSDDYLTHFFHYDGKNIIPIGTIEGFYGYMHLIDSDGWIEIPGDGSVKTSTRGSILQTWFFEDEYSLIAEHTLKQVHQDFYDMDTDVKLLVELTLYNSMDNSDIGITLYPGDRGTITLCDNKRWCLIETEDGDSGWFEVVNYSEIESLGLSSYEVFEGLDFAD